MKNFFKYARVDFYRAICSRRFIIGVVGVFLCMCLGMCVDGGYNISVLYVFDAVTYGIPFLLVTIFSAFPYAISIQDDEKNGYMYLLISRGNIISYTFSKCCVISISSILTIVLGVLCFVVMCKMGLPWIADNDTTFEILSQYGGLRFFLINQKFILYYILYALQYGILTALLSMLSTLISLFVSDQFLIFTIPIISFYIISFLVNQIFRNNTADLYNIFNASVNIWNDDMKSYFYAISIGAVGFVILTILISSRILRKVKKND